MIFGDRDVIDLEYLHKTQISNCWAAYNFQCSHSFDLVDALTLIYNIWVILTLADVLRNGYNGA
jgi:hypothetical protein